MALTIKLDFLNFEKTGSPKSEIGKDYYKSILNSVPGMVFIFDNELRYRIVTKSGLAFLNSTEDFMLGMPVGKEGLMKFSALVKRFKISNSPFLQVKMKLNGANGERWFLISFSQFKENQEIVVVCFDIHDQVLMEDQALEQRGIVENSARMAAIGQVAAGIAHEINNPLAVIISKSQQIKRRVSADQLALIQRDLEKIESTGFRIANIIKGLRALSRDGEQESFELVRLHDVMKDVNSMFEEKIRENQIDFQIHIDDQLYVEARPTQMGQVLLNLISNSYDAVKNLNPRWIRVVAKKIPTPEGSEVEIHVTDSGPGIPPGIREKLMTPFFTTKSAGHGTGLGLSISKKILRDHQGDLYLNPESTSTDFVIRLPSRQPTKKAS